MVTESNIEEDLAPLATRLRDFVHQVETDIKAQTPGSTQRELCKEYAVLCIALVMGVQDLAGEINDEVVEVFKNAILAINDL